MSSWKRIYHKAAELQAGQPNPLTKSEMRTLLSRIKAEHEKNHPRRRAVAWIKAFGKLPPEMRDDR